MFKRRLKRCLALNEKYLQQIKEQQRTMEYRDEKLYRSQSSENCILSNRRKWEYLATAAEKQRFINKNI